jgi:hypothetical protein
LKYVCPATFMTTHPEDKTYLMACMIEASIEMVDILYDKEEERDGFAGVTIAEQALRTGQGAPSNVLGAMDFPNSNKTTKPFTCGKTVPIKPNTSFGPIFKRTSASSGRNETADNRRNKSITDHKTTTDYQLQGPYTQTPTGAKWATQTGASKNKST